MRTLSLAEDSHEISSLIFLKLINKKFQNFVCCSLDWCFMGKAWFVVAFMCPASTLLLMMNGKKMLIFYE